MCASSLAPTQSYVRWDRGLFPRVNRPGHETDHSVPSGDEIKNDWSCTSFRHPLSRRGQGKRRPFAFSDAVGILESLASKG